MNQTLIDMTEFCARQLTQHCHAAQNIEAVLGFGFILFFSVLSFTICHKWHDFSWIPFTDEVKLETLRYVQFLFMLASAAFMVYFWFFA